MVLRCSKCNNFYKGEYQCNKNTNYNINVLLETHKKVPEMLRLTFLYTQQRF